MNSHKIRVLYYTLSYQREKSFRLGNLKKKSSKQTDAYVQYLYVFFYIQDLRFDEIYVLIKKIIKLFDVIMRTKIIRKAL